MRTSGSSIGKRIRAARRAKGLKQQCLADAVGVSRSAVAQWETDRAGQITGNLGRIAAVLEVDLDWLMHGVERHLEGPLTHYELAILRLLRKCSQKDQRIILEVIRRLARSNENAGV
jgi:transcriptional regulator with XRE-family HTH domain